MILSLNEIEFMAKKAARGAGYSWGIAEEAGKAVRWLNERGIDGAGALHTCLKDAPARAHCPLHQGASLADHAQFLPRRLSDISQPVLLLPFAAMASRLRDEPVALSLDSAMAMTDGSYLQIRGTISARATQIELTPATADLPPACLTRRANPDPAVWEGLCQLAHKTYAPASEQSRQSGAGATEYDND